MNVNEIHQVGFDLVMDLLLGMVPKYDVRSLVIHSWEEGPQIRFTIDIEGKPVTFAVEVEPFLPVGWNVAQPP